jgi:hypothetical protein
MMVAYISAMNMYYVHSEHMLLANDGCLSAMNMYYIHSERMLLANDDCLTAVIMWSFQYGHKLEPMMTIYLLFLCGVSNLSTSF